MQNYLPNENKINLDNESDYDKLYCESMDDDTVI